jgi:DNA uptake protein ComE-like DNA-binding protein
VVLVDINASSVEILKSLPGIGDAEAERIVAGRPYRTKAELVTKNVLPQGTYLSIKQAITVELKPKKRTDVHRAKP